jgi:hypothetical protein
MMKIKYFYLIVIIIFLSQFISAATLGDVNEDDQITIVDALLVAQYYVGLLGDEINESNSDVDGDGDIDILDALLIAQYYVNIITCFPPECTTPEPTPPSSGTLISVEGCLQLTDSREEPEITAQEECISYTYNEADQTLSISHIHAGFNCCVFPTGDVEINGNTIDIIESFTGDDICDCECLFNLNYEVNNVVPGEYTFTVNCVYPLQEDLTFTVDLSEENTGVYCVTRDRYPWI